MGKLTLTFDDGPDEVTTRSVLAELDRCDVRATFFVVGERVHAAPDVVAAMLDAGHTVELHCYRHLRHSELSEAEIEVDTIRALELLHGFELSPRFWRTPWGVRTTASENVATRHGLTLVGWDIDTHDWRGDSAAAMRAVARANLPDGGVVLMHDALGPGARRDDCGNTVELIPALVAAARNAGVEIGALEPLAESAARP